MFYFAAGRSEDSEAGVATPRQRVPGLATRVALANSRAMLLLCGLLLAISAYLVSGHIRNIYHDKAYAPASAFDHSIGHRPILNDPAALNKNIDETLRLSPELNEATLLNNVSDAREKIEAVKKLGIRVSVDDYGAGFASLTCLKNLELDEIKLDRELLHNISQSERDREMLGAIINMSRSLKLNLVAEGVETEGSTSFCSATTAAFSRVCTCRHRRRWRASTPEPGLVKSCGRPLPSGVTRLPSRKTGRCETALTGRAAARRRPHRAP